MLAGQFPVYRGDASATASFFPVSLHRHQRQGSEVPKHKTGMQLCTLKGQGEYNLLAGVEYERIYTFRILPQKT